VSTTQVAPGVAVEHFQLGGKRGVRDGRVVRVDLRAPGVGFGVVGPRNVAAVDEVADMVDPEAVVGVNGDFFDIDDTDAPLGIARDRRGVRNGVASGWNSAFWTDRRGVPHIGPLYAAARVRQRPALRITTVNSPSVRAGEVGVYTHRWGTLRGYRVVDGDRERVRMVVVRDGRVVTSWARFPRRVEVTDTVLVGRGKGAAQLKGFRRGDRVAVDLSLSERTTAAVTGSGFLVRDGKRLPADNGELHPRTAVGIDRDGHQVLLLVVDGRQESSSGVSLRELGRLFRRLGAEDALNLDGGGSSILVARQPDGSLATLNSPSDGLPRPVANGLEVTYSAG
jgi:hypothetical protein